MATLKAELALPSRQASRFAFSRAAATFDAARFVHDWTRQRLLDRLPLLRIEPKVIVDVGCATGKGATALAQLFPAARVLALDNSVEMLFAVERGQEDRFTSVAGDAERMPLATQAVSLLLANLVLPWCRPELFFKEAARVLAPHGVLLFATFGPDTLREVRRAWGSVDREIHVHAAFDMHDLGDRALAAGLAEPVLDVERITLSYCDVRDLVRDLRACGAVNTAAGRRSTLTGPKRWRAFAEALEAGRRGERFDVTVEVIFGQAFGGGMRARAEGEVVIPLTRLGRRGRGGDA